MSEIGHNSGDTAIGGIAAEALRQYVERWERLEDEKKAISADQKDVLSQAKNAGFDVSIIRQILRLRKMDEQERMETEQLVELYKRALNMV